MFKVGEYALCDGYNNFLSRMTPYLVLASTETKILIETNKIGTFRWYGKEDFIIYPYLQKGDIVRFKEGSEMIWPKEPIPIEEGIVANIDPDKEYCYVKFYDKEEVSIYRAKDLYKVFILI